MAVNYGQNLQIASIFLDAGRTISKILVTSTPLLTKPAAECQLQRQATVISEQKKWKVASFPTGNESASLSGGSPAQEKWFVIVKIQWFFHGNVLTFVAPK